MQSELQPPGKPQHVKIVAGNKCDLADKREVKSEDGLKWARGNGCGFMETSAREVVNVEETFERKLRESSRGRRVRGVGGGGTWRASLTGFSVGEKSSCGERSGKDREAAG